MREQDFDHHLKLKDYVTTRIKSSQISNSDVWLSNLSFSCHSTISYLVYVFCSPLCPAEMPVTPNNALKSPSDSFLTLQDASTEFKIVSTTTQQLGPGVQVRL